MILEIPNQVTLTRHLQAAQRLLISLVNNPLVVSYFFRFHLYFADGLEKCLTTDSHDAINILLFQTRHANALENIKHETS